MSIGIGFLIKKGVSFLLMPLTIGMFLLLIGLFFLYRKNLKKAKRYISLSILWVAFISYAPIVNLFFIPLESQYQKLETIPTDVKYILLLGGDKEKRAWEALRLYNSIPNAKVITSGYSMYDKLSEAQKTAKLLIESGIKERDIFMQSDVFDTHDEAVSIKKRLGKKPFFLVTSAYHMPRAMKFFQKEGLNPIPAPTDFNNPKEDGWGSIFTSKQLEKTEHTWHEYLGLLWLKINS